MRQSPNFTRIAFPSSTIGGRIFDASLNSTTPPIHPDRFPFFHQERSGFAWHDTAVETYLVRFLFYSLPDRSSATPVIKLALVIPTLDRSGAEKQFTLLATRLPRDEFDVHVIVLTQGGPYEQELNEAEIPVTIIGKRWKFDPAAFAHLRSKLRELHPDIVHTWLFAANAYGRLVGGARPPWQTIVSERCVDSWKAGWQLWLDKRLISRTDRLVGNSQSVADFYQQQGFPADRISVIPNGIELPEQSRAGRDELLRELNLPPDAKLIGHVGRLARQKRVGDLLWAIQVLRQADERAYLLIIGDGPERDALIQRAASLECAHHVRFLGHRSDVSKLMQLLDVYWLGSDFEGMSNSLMEAMATGLPVVVTNIPPNRELVQHDRQGYLVDVGDGVGFAQFTTRLIQQEDLARRLGDAGRQRMSEEFSVDGMVQAYAALYRELCAKPQAAFRRTDSS
ncbi:MAG: glycosyltransferase [Planctomycetaceae bacterium]